MLATACDPPLSPADVPCPGVGAERTDKMSGEEALFKIRAENEELEAAIATIKASQGATQEFVAPTEPAGGIKVLNFGTSKIASEAGVDKGSSWCPPQCARRTVLGGMFTS